MSMQKNVVIAIVVILILGAGGFFLFQNQNKTNVTGGENKNNIVTSIKDALMKSASLECDFTDEQGTKSKVYIKNGSVRSDYTGASAEQSGSVILVNKKMYMWTGKKGFMIEVPEVTPGQENTEESKTKQQDDFMANLEKYKESCKTSVVSDSLFTPPSDVEFQDYSQMMNNLAPTIGAGAGMSEDQVKQYMQQYSNPQQ